MSDERRRLPAEAPLAGADEMGEEKRRELSGEPAAGDQEAFRRAEEVDQLGQLTETDIYHGELEAGVHDDLPTEDRAENIETLTELELRDGETGDAGVAAEEGMTYVPPSDPPIRPADDPQGAEMAAGFATSSTDDPADAGAPATALPDEDDMSGRVREALRADAATSRYADSVAIGTRGRTVALRGTVDDLEDSDSLVEVAGRVRGVDEVVDELEVRGL